MSKRTVSAANSNPSAAAEAAQAEPAVRVTSEAESACQKAAELGRELERATEEHRAANGRLQEFQDQLANVQADERELLRRLGEARLIPANPDTLASIESEASQLERVLASARTRVRALESVVTAKAAAIAELQQRAAEASTVAHRLTQEERHGALLSKAENMLVQVKEDYAQTARDFGEFLTLIDQLSAIGRELGQPYDSAAAELLDRVWTTAYRWPDELIMRGFRAKNTGWGARWQLPIPPLIAPSSDHNKRESGGDPTGAE